MISVIIVVYDSTRAEDSLILLNRMLEYIRCKWELTVVSNHKDIGGENVVAGSNSAAEFSGYDEGVISAKKECEYILFLNDTWHLKGAGKALTPIALARRIEQLVERRVDLAGERSVAIDSLGTRVPTCTEWLRTSIFLMRRDVYLRIGPFSSMHRNFHSRIQYNGVQQSLSYSGPLDCRFSSRIQVWFGKGSAETGWTRLQESTDERVRSKIASVLTELTIFKLASEELGLRIESLVQPTIKQRILVKLCRWQRSFALRGCLPSAGE